MKATLQVDAQIYEMVSSIDSSNIAKDQVRTFYSRYEIDHFVNKAADSDIAALHQALDDPTIIITNKPKLLEAVADQIEKGLLKVQLAAGGSGAPNAASKPPIPGSDITEGISDRYSPDMKRFIASNRNSVGQLREVKRNAGLSQLGNVSTNAAPDPQKALNFKIVVEIAGRNPCPKQHIEIQSISSEKTAEQWEKSQKKRAQHHNRDRHRSIVEFKKLPNKPRGISLVVPTKGYGADIRLPLNIEIATVDNQKENTEWALLRFDEVKRGAKASLTC